MPKYYVLQDKEYSLPDLVDRIGTIRRKIKQHKVIFEKIRAILLKAKKEGKVLGKEYYAMIELFDHTYLDEKKLRKFVSAKILKKCYSTNEDVKRVKIFKRK